MTTSVTLHANRIGDDFEVSTRHVNGHPSDLHTLTICNIDIYLTRKRLTEVIESIGRYLAETRNGECSEPTGVVTPDAYLSVDDEAATVANYEEYF